MRKVERISGDGEGPGGKRERERGWQRGLATRRQLPGLRSFQLHNRRLDGPNWWSYSPKFAKCALPLHATLVPKLSFSPALLSSANTSCRSSGPLDIERVRGITNASVEAFVPKASLAPLSSASGSSRDPARCVLKLDESNSPRDLRFDPHPCRGFLRNTRTTQPRRINHTT